MQRGNKEERIVKRHSQKNSLQQKIVVFLIIFQRRQNQKAYLKGEVATTPTFSITQPLPLALR